MLAAQVAQGPADEGAYVVDLGDRHVISPDRRGVPRRTASVMKRFTTATALMGSGRGQTARLATLVNQPSDTYRADVMPRALGARLQGQRSGAAGALAVSDAMRLRLHPEVMRGSGRDRGGPVPGRPTS